MADVEETPAEEPVEEPESEEEEDFVAVGGVTEVKLFGKWSFDDIEIRDISLVVSSSRNRVGSSSSSSEEAAIVIVIEWL